MGYMRHHAIIVTSWDRELVEKAYLKAEEIFYVGFISNLTGPTTNGYSSFFVPPDGSKEGWGESDIGDEKRRVFIDWLIEQAYDDGSNCLEFVEVEFSNDDIGASVINDSYKKLD